MRRGLMLATAVMVFAVTTVAAIIVFQLQEGNGQNALAEEQIALYKGQAIDIATDFLESGNRTVGQVLLTAVQEKTPNTYWHEMFGLESNVTGDPRLCWIVRFETPVNPGHYVEVWVDGSTGDVVGGTQCR